MTTRGAGQWPHLPLALVIVLLATGSSTSGLQSQETARPAALHEIAAELDSAALIRISARTIRTSGVLQALIGPRLMLATDSAQVAFDLTQVDSLWIQSTGKRNGSLIGMSAGLALTTLSCAQTFDECGLDAGLLIITPALALFGAGVGSMITGWRLLYP